MEAIGPESQATWKTIPDSEAGHAEDYKTVSDVSPDLVPHLPSED
jgi:hypothetical protein